MFEFKLILLTCLLGHLLQGSESIFRRRQFANPVKIDAQRKDYGEPVFLTPLIQAGQIKEARIRSLVTGLPGLPKASQVESYSGFITVNPKANGNLFFWFFPAKDPNAPVMVWLQGGPGGSSLYGLFAEHGPLEITQNLTANIREFAWTNVASMIYIDNPVGTGFSFVDSEDGYVTNEVQVGNDLFEFLRQFFIVFSEYNGNEFYVTGESYAGKYVPAIGYRIHKNNSIGLNFKGIAVGDGLCDPENMFAYGNYLYQVGLLDEKQRNYFRSEEEKAVYYIKNGQYLEAFRTFDSLLNGDLLTTPSAFTNFTGSTNYFNFLHSGNYVPEYYNQYLALAETRRAIHVGNLTYNDGSAVEKHLLNDVMQSVRPWVGVLMDNYKVLMYSGQLDIIVAAPLTESFLRKVEWKGSKDYRRASRSIWKVSPSDSEVAGYVRRVGDFRQVIVRKAGHMVPYDQPRAALDMIQRFINNKL